MQEIQSKISQVMSIVFRPSHHREELIDMMVSKPFELDVPFFEKMLATFKLLKLDKEFEPIMNYLWDTSFDFMNFGRKRKNDFKDWRKILQDQIRIWILKDSYFSFTKY